MTAVLNHPTPSTSTTTAPDRLPPSHASRRPWKRIIIDTALLITLALSLLTIALGNMFLHAAAGTAFALVAIAHVALNRTWVRATWRRRTSLNGRTRTNAIVDSILAASWIAITLSGFAAWLGMLPALGAIHGASAAVLIAVTVVHLAMHRRWISRASGRFRWPLTP